MTDFKYPYVDPKQAHLAHCSGCEKHRGWHGVEQVAMTRAEQLFRTLYAKDMYEGISAIAAIDAALHAEREACAKVCDDNRNEQGDYIAALIRKVTP